MSESYKFHTPEEIYFTTSTVVDWIDAFTRPEYSLIIVDSLRYCIGNKGLRVHAWCIMSNHIHLVVSAQAPALLHDIFRDFKKYTSKKIVQAIQEIPESRRDWMLYRFEYAGKYQQRIDQYKFWQDGNHPILCSDGAMLRQKVDYIHDNPVRRMLVQEAQQYPFSSAIDYCGGKGMLPVELLF